MPSIKYYTIYIKLFHMENPNIICVVHSGLRVLVSLHSYRLE